MAGPVALPDPVSMTAMTIDPTIAVDIEAGYIYLFDDRAERLACIRLMRKNLGLLRNLL
ncbi:hypothetical protein GCM10011608_36840 [Micromonospora sonchi]|uniref:Uncharacterized protein n=1 Tax=Micromonospora sonchi TaxID=1763543 RepID=A0A917U2M5_9ACTN|nr:hypothetical protein GCM10011608_36840 [Micromonospora sonchi]